HADWVDAQLRAWAAPAAGNAGELAKPGSSYTWVVPWAPEAESATRAQHREAAHAVETQPRREAAAVAPSPARPPVEPGVGARAPVAAAALARSAQSPFALPDLRLEAALSHAPSVAAARVEQFLDRLVGSQVVRDVEALPVAFARPPVEQPASAERA